MFRCLTCQTRRGFRVFQQRDYVRLAYDTYLPDAGRQPRMERPPLLVLHGLLGSKQNWRSLAKLMSQSLNTKVIAVDLRNHGQSPVTETMSFHEIGKDLDGVLEAEQIDTFHLLGHSMVSLCFDKDTRGHLADDSQGRQGRNALGALQERQD